MKRLLKSLLIAAALIAVPRWGFAATQVDGSQLFNETALSYSKQSATLNTNGIDNLSLQMVISSYVPVSQTIFDGRKSTATIAVSSNTALAWGVATDTITVGSNSGATVSAVAGSYLTLNGVVFKEGGGGKYTYSLGFSTVTATNLAAAIQADGSGLFTAVASSNVVVVQTTSSGTSVNSYTCTSSTPAALTCGSPTFINGRDNALLAINGYTLRASVQFTVGASSQATAKAISDAMMADNRINAIVISTWNIAGVVTTTATAVGVNAYTLFTSTPNALQLNGSATATTGTYLNGLVSDVISNTFTKTNHGFVTGQELFYTSVTGTPPQNLTSLATYYAIRDTASTFRLASTLANSTSTTPTAITISTVAGAGTNTLVPLTLAGSPAYTIQVSNDGTNWSNLSITSGTYTFATPYTSANFFYDLGTPSYNFIRASYTKGSAGAVGLTITANGRRSGQ